MNINEVIVNCVIELVGGDWFEKYKLIYLNDYVNMG